MTNGRKIYFFILGNLFGIALTVLIMTVFTDSISYNHYTQKVEFDNNKVLTSIKSGFSELKGVGGTCEKYSKFEEVWDTLSLQYFDKEKLDEQKALDGAVKGFVESLKDPYTSYFDAEENTSFQDALKGESDFEGIGAVVSKKEKGVLLEEIFKDSPSFKAGLKPLDIVIAVDGEKIQSLSLNEAVSKMRGPKGTEVTLTIYRESESNVFDVVVTRDKISVPSVAGEIVNLTGGVDIAYIELSSFGEETENLFNKTVKELNSKMLDGIVLDLRGNGGGFLQSAVGIASHFVPKGKVVVTSKYRTYSPETYESSGYGDLEGLPVVILIDGMSASASEILAAGLKDLVDATLVGKKSFGKGSIQTVHDMEDGSSVKYTIGKWYRPSGGNVDLEGLPVDIEVDLDAELYLSGGVDTQLNKANEVLLDIINKK
ncbi:MAG: S41 family peptidase [Candidatus Absconditabacteria bacterium]